PPKGKLADDEISLLRTWILQGAVFPTNATTAGPVLGIAATPDGIKQSRVGHWSYQPIVRPLLPRTNNADRSQNPLDPCVLARLESAGLAPGPTADRRTLLRRATFDLIGLPPSFDEVMEFEQDASPDALDRAVDRLLASSHYGERWGRHW